MESQPWDTCRQLACLCEGSRDHSAAIKKALSERAASEMAPVGTLCATKQYMQKMTNTLCSLGCLQRFYYSSCQGNSSAGWMLHCNRKILLVGTVWKQDQCHQQTCRTTEKNNKALLKNRGWAADLSSGHVYWSHWNGDRGNRSLSVSNKTKMRFPIWDHCALLSWSAPAFTQAQQCHRGWNRPMSLSSLKRSRDNNFSHC